MVLTSKIIEQTIQSEGTQRVQVAFTDHLGRIHNRSYDFPKDADVNVEILTRQIHVEQGLEDQEIEQAVSKVLAGKIVSLEYATEEDLKIRLQEIEIEKHIEVNKLTIEISNLSVEVSKL